MAATDGFEIPLPSKEDLDAAEAAWVDGIIRYEVPNGETYWRVLRAPTSLDAMQYAEVCYPSDSQTRFAPVLTAGAIVPAAYAGASPEVALWEVVLRNIRHAGHKRVPRHETRDRYLVEIKTIRELNSSTCVGRLFQISWDRESAHPT